jgi:hypothetical protein
MRWQRKGKEAYRTGRICTFNIMRRLVYGGPQSCIQGKPIPLSVTQAQFHSHPVFRQPISGPMTEDYPHLAFNHSLRICHVFGPQVKSSFRCTGYFLQYKWWFWANLLGKNFADEIGSPANKLLLWSKKTWSLSRQKDIYHHGPKPIQYTYHLPPSRPTFFLIGPNL